MTDVVNTDALRQEPSGESHQGPKVKATPQVKTDTSPIVQGLSHVPEGQRMHALAYETEPTVVPVDHEIFQGWVNTNFLVPQMSICIDGVTGGIAMPKLASGELAWDDFLASRLSAEEIAETKDLMIRGHLAHRQHPVLTTESQSHPAPHPDRVDDQRLQRLWSDAKISISSLALQFADWAETASKRGVILPPLAETTTHVLEMDTSDAENYLSRNAKRLDAFFKSPQAKPYLSLLLRLMQRTYDTVDPRRKGTEAARLALIQRNNNNDKKLQGEPSDQIPQEEFAGMLETVATEEIARFHADHPDIIIPSNMAEMYLATFVESRDIQRSFTYPNE